MGGPGGEITCQCYAKALMSLESGDVYVLPSQSRPLQHTLDPKIRVIVGILIIASFLGRGSLWSSVQNPWPNCSEQYCMCLILLSASILYVYYLKTLESG